MRPSLYYKAMIFLLVMIACVAAIGCGSGLVESTSNQSSPLSTALELTPSTGVVQQGSSIHFGFSASNGTIADSHCTWSSGNVELLVSEGSGTYIGKGLGSTTVSATCYGQTASAMVSVTSPANPMAIRITAGGIYTGNWNSIDPKVPAVTILTDEPVALRNSTISSRGDLIVVYGGPEGANLTIDNVTGTALDPGIAGQGRGTFLDAEVMSRLSVTHCIMHGVSFGIYIVSSKLESLNLRDNIADNLEDRKSNGNGGFLLNQRLLGHFIMFNGVAMPNGGEVAWNQMINSDGVASVEDVISFYQSHGSSEKPVLVHDNYLHGAFATGQTTPYTGGGIQMDGGSNDPSTATGFVHLENNTVVHLAGFGISIAAGHDISVFGNRIVSCGKDSSGNWIGMPGSSALVMWNYYQTSQYFNNYMTNNSGGLVRPDANGNPSIGDVAAPSASSSLNDIVGANFFEQPCLASSNPNLIAESLEWDRWLKTVALSGESLGDQH
jgi:hypothetical protein